MLLIALAAAGEATQGTIQLSYSMEQYWHRPDGTLAWAWPATAFNVEFPLTGKVVHGWTNGIGYVINRATLSASGAFRLQAPGYFTHLEMRVRVRGSGELDLLSIDAGSGTLLGAVTVEHSAFGSSEHVLAVWPWAVPQGSVSGKGWWLVFISSELYGPIGGP